MELYITPARRLAGSVKIPGDKSISHRAAMLGALAEGETRIDNFLEGADCLSTLACLRGLGVEIEGPDGGRVTVRGRGSTALQEPREILDAGNSGTTMRLLLGILAGLPFFSVITGDSSLRGRPMGRVAQPLRAMGAVIAGREGGNLAPLAVQGRPLQGIDFISPVASAQLKSAVLLAGLLARGSTKVTEPHLSRDHTERMLAHFGAPVRRDGLAVTLAGGSKLQCRSITVPGDISSAAFFMVAGSIVPETDIILEHTGINPTRSGILDVLQAMGADITLLNPRHAGGEPVADIRVRSSRLKGTEIKGSLIPRLIDEIPVLAVAAAVAQGETVIRDAAELRIKETDRLTAIREELGRMGAAIEELPDGLLIKGGGRLKGARCRSRDDHRMAMAAATAGLVAEGETVVVDAECMEVSFPDFPRVLNSLRVE